MNESKTPLVLSALLLFCCIATQAAATDYIVSGAGTEAVNGIYTENGTYNDRPK